MKMRTRRSQTIQVEFMERRETPSGITGAAAIVEAVPLSAAISQFHLNASGTSTSQMTLPDGSSGMLAVVVGRATVLGQFQGQLLVIHSQGENTGVALACFIGGNGSTLSMTIDALGSSGAQNGDQPQPSIRGRYLITGGAGALSGARAPARSRFLRIRRAAISRSRCKGRSRSKNLLNVSPGHIHGSRERVSKPSRLANVPAWAERKRPESLHGTTRSQADSASDVNALDAASGDSGSRRILLIRVGSARSTVKR